MKTFLPGKTGAATVTLKNARKFKTVVESYEAGGIVCASVNWDSEELKSGSIWAKSFIPYSEIEVITQTLETPEVYSEPV